MQPNRLAGDRLEQAPLAELDVRDAVQGEVEGCESQRSPVHVRRDDVLRMAGEQERLDPVPRAGVERPFDRLPDGQVRERRPRGGGRPRRGPRRRRRAGRRRSGGRRGGRRARARAATRLAPRRGPPSTSSSACSPAGTGSPSSSSEMSTERLSGTAASRRRYTSRSTCVKIGSPVVCRRRAIPAPV